MADEPKPAKPRTRASAICRVIFWLGIASVAAASVSAVVLCLFAAEVDFQYANMALYAVGGFTFLTVMWWFTFVSRLPTGVRYLPLVVSVLSIAGFFAMYKVKEVSGELVPSFTPRWDKRHDQMLPPIEVRSREDVADLKTTTPADFPQFLGPDRNMYLPNVRLARDWNADPPQELWRQPIGAGWSGFAVVNAYAVTMEQRGDEELVSCYEVTTGKPMWTNGIEVRHTTVLGGIGPRSTVTIDEGRVYAMGATGVLRCLDGATGELIWKDDVVQRFGLDATSDLAIVAWGRANSPLIVDDLVVVPAGGSGDKLASLVAFDKRTGEFAWQGGNQQISYASPTLRRLVGREQIVIVNEATVSGHDPATGEALWMYPWNGSSNSNASVSNAAVLPNDRVLLSKGYSGGSEMIRLQANGEATQVWDRKSLLKTKFTNVCVIGGYAYALSDGILECVELETGERQWKRGRYRHGQILGVGDVLLVLGEAGELTMVDATPDRHEELGSLQALEGKTWNTLCLTGKYLLLRNGQEAACYELKLAENE